jgi:O-antigen ligase
MPALIFNFLLFFLPFIFIPISSLNFEIPKVILGEFLIELLFVILILKNKFPIKLGQKKLLIPIAIIFLLTLNPSSSIFGNEFRKQGIFLLWHLMLFAIISSVFKFKILNFKYLKYLLIAELILGFLIGFTIDGRIVGTIGEPNALASFVVFLFPFSGNLTLSIIIIFLTGSRAGLIAFVIEIIALFLVKRKFKLNKIVLICATLILFSLLIPFVTKSESIYENRSEIWTTAFVTGFKSPVFGNGFGNIALNSRVDSSHNIILDYWIQGGIIGLTAFLFLVYFTIKNFLAKKQTIYLISFLGLFTTMLFNPASVVNLIAFWWLIGVSFA